MATTSDEAHSAPATAVELLSSGPDEPYSKRIKGWIFAFFLLFSALFGMLCSLFFI